MALPATLVRSGSTQAQFCLPLQRSANCSRACGSIVACAGAACSVAVSEVGVRRFLERAVVVGGEENKADQAENEGQADGPGRNVCTGPDRPIAAEQLVERGAAPDCRDERSAARRPPASKSRTKDKSGRRVAATKRKPGWSRMSVNTLPMNYPFSSSAVSTSTVMWLL